MAKKELIPAIEYAGKLEKVAGDEFRFYRTKEQFKAEFRRRDGFTFYKFFYTMKDLTAYTIMSSRYKTKLVAYYEYKGDYKK